jgi:uncharacterized membrane protein YccC
MIGPRLRTSLRSAIAASVALLIALALQWPYPYWAAIMVIVIMSPSLSAGISLFPIRLAGVATGAALGFLTVAFFGQDRIPFLVASSAILFIFGVGASSSAYGPLFSMGAIAFPAVAIFGYANFQEAVLLAFYRFASASLGVLVFTVSHLVIWPGSSAPPARPLPPTDDTKFLFGLPLRRWLGGARLGIGAAVAQTVWFEVRPPGAYVEALIACVLLAICSSMPRPRILYALGGILCATVAAFCVAYLGWATLPLNPETLFLTVTPVLFLFALVQSAGPPYALFGVFGSVMFLVALNLSHAQALDLQTFISKSFGIAIGGIVAALVLRIFSLPMTGHAPGTNFF